MKWCRHWRHSRYSSAVITDDHISKEIMNKIILQVLDILGNISFIIGEPPKPQGTNLFWL